MDTSRGGSTSDGWSESGPLLLLDAFETALAWGRRPPDAAQVLCLMAGRTVGAPSVGYVLHDPTNGGTRITVWRESDPGRGIVTHEKHHEPSGDDWWTTSPGRRHLFSALDQTHLAELPLSTDPRSPSFIVVARSHPFIEPDVDKLARARRALCLLERLLGRLEAPPPTPAAVPAQTPSPDTCPDLTGRELEVLHMLAEGLLARSIAQRLEVSERTVHKHLGNLYRKLDAHDRLLAVRRAEGLGLVLPAEPGTSEPAARW